MHAYLFITELLSIFFYWNICNISIRSTDFVQMQWTEYTYCLKQI